MWIVDEEVDMAGAQVNLESAYTPYSSKTYSYDFQSDLDKFLNEAFSRFYQGGNDMTAATLTKPEAGDRVKLTIEGKVKDLYGLRVVEAPNGKYIDVESGKAEVVEKAPMGEPKPLDSVVEVSYKGNQPVRYVKRSDGWHHIPTDVDWDDTRNISSSGVLWSDMLISYAPKYGYTITVLSGKPGLPKDHKVRDLNGEQHYTRESGSTLYAYRRSNGSLNLNGNYLKKDEAIALAWDILKLYGKVE